MCPPRTHPGTGAGRKRRRQSGRVAGSVAERVGDPAAGARNGDVGHCEGDLEPARPAHRWRRRRRPPSGSPAPAPVPATAAHPGRRRRHRELENWRALGRERGIGRRLAGRAGDQRRSRRGGSALGSRRRCGSRPGRSGGRRGRLFRVAAPPSCARGTVLFFGSARTPRCRSACRPIEGPWASREPRDVDASGAAGACSAVAVAASAVSGVSRRRRDRSVVCFFRLCGPGLGRDRAAARRFASAAGSESWFVGRADRFLVVVLVVDC